MGYRKAERPCSLKKYIYIIIMIKMPLSAGVHVRGAVVDRCVGHGVEGSAHQALGLRDGSTARGGARTLQVGDVADVQRRRPNAGQRRGGRHPHGVEGGRAEINENVRGLFFFLFLPPLGCLLIIV